MPPLSQEQTNVINNANQNAKVNADTIANAQPTPNLPSSQANLFDLTQYLQPSVNETQQQKDIGNMQDQTSSVFEQLLGAQKSTETRGSQTTQLEQNAGIPTMNLELSNLNTTIRQKALEFRREQEAIQNEPLTVAQKNARLADVSRKQASQMADYEVARAALSDSLNAIQSIIDRKVQRQFADEDARINNLKYTYETLKSDLTKTQDRAYNEMIKREERAFGIAKDKYTQVENTKAELVKNARLNGAGAGVIEKIMASKDLAEAYTNAGNYGLSIDDKIKQAQLSKLYSELQPDDAKSADSAVKIIGTLNEAIGNTGGLRAAVGPNILTRGGAAPGDKKRFLSATQQVINDLTLNTFAEAKAKGITFGSASEGEWKLLQSAATRLDAYATRDKNNNIVRFKTTEGNVKQELDYILDNAKQSYQKKTGRSYDDDFGVKVDENGNVVVPGDTTDEGFWNNNV